MKLKLDLLRLLPVGSGCVRGNRPSHGSVHPVRARLITRSMWPNVQAHHRTPWAGTSSSLDIGTLARHPYCWKLQLELRLELIQSGKCPLHVVHLILHLVVLRLDLR